MRKIFGILLLALSLTTQADTMENEFGNFLVERLSAIDSALAMDSSPLEPDFGFFTLSFGAGFGISIPGLIGAQIVPQVEFTWFKLPTKH